MLPDDTVVEANKTYRWRFTPANGSYTTLTGAVELYHRSSSGGSGNGGGHDYTFENVTEEHTIEVIFMKANGNPQTGVSVNTPDLP